jgi:hypothetical protein
MGYLIGIASVVLGILALALLNSRRSDVHKHKCPNCRYIWEHDAADITYANDEAEHTCPSCGTEQRWHYCGPEPVSAPLVKNRS